MKNLKSIINGPAKLKLEPETLSIFCMDTISVVDSPIVWSLLIFTLEVVESLREYGEVLRSIHNRLISEGYVINRGKIYKPDGV